MADEGGFLPPEPPGPEPDLGGTPRPAPPAPGQETYAPPQGAPALPPPRQGGWTPPPPQSWQQHNPNWQGQQQSGSGPSGPSNGDAVAGFTCSLVAGSLLVVSVGLSSLVSAVTAGFGVFYSRKGRANVEEGRTTRHHGLADAGFWIGVISLVLAVLATIFWVLVLILYLSDDEFQQEIDDAIDDETNTSAVPLLRAGAAALRGAVALL